jgi:hypothetical protein
MPPVTDLPTIASKASKGAVVKIRTTTAALVVALAAMVVAGAAVAGAAKKIPFSGKYAGTAVTKVTDNVADITANGAGAATPIGAGKITGKGTGDSSVQPCVPFTGTGSITGAKGTVQFKVIPGSTGCGDEGGQVFSITARATVLKATGALAKAKGSLKFTGVYDRGAGTFSVKVTGLLTR